MTLSSISQNRIYSIVLEKMPFIMSVGERGRKEGEEESSQFPEGLGFREEEKRGLKKKVQESRQSLLSLSLSSIGSVQYREYGIGRSFFAKKA